MKRFFAAVWRVINVILRVIQAAVTLAIVAIFIALLVATLTTETVTVPDGAALIVAPAGNLVEELEGDAFQRALAEAQGNGPRQTLLRDVVDALDDAAGDDRIRAVVLRLGDLDGGGFSKLREVAAAVKRVREAGKPVIAYGDSFTQNQYFLAAHASEVYLHDLGTVLIEGFGYYRTYLKSAIDKLSLDLNVFRVGEFKSFVEPLIRDDMSAADRQASEQWLDELWRAYQSDVIAARNLGDGALDAYASEFADKLETLDGNAAKLSVEAGLVDATMTRQAAERRIAALVNGTADEAPDDGAQADAEYESIGYADYIRIMRAESALDRKRDNVGIIVASGQIIDGEALPGTVGGDSLAARIAEAGQDETIDAVVLRVDSPGGSMFASEVVFDQIQQFRRTGKPLVVSMSSVAASGGYYISMLADEIWAADTTLTGSIGIGVIVPTVQRSLQRLGINVDGFGTTELAGQFRLDRELGAEARRIIQSIVENGYRVFVDKVATSRDMSVERVEDIAQGRVWIGADAEQLGLVDHLGGLNDAVDSAASLAGLAPDEFGVKWLQPELTLRERLLRSLAMAAGSRLASLRSEPAAWSTSALGRVVTAVEADLRRLAALNDPRGLYYHCFCVIP